MKYYILLPLLIPHLICYSLSNKKTVIDEDIIAWSKYRKRVDSSHLVKSLIYLLVEQKDFRAQFYLRIGRIRILLRLLLPDIKCYSFEGCEIGGGWVLMHGFGVVLNGGAKIGRNCTMYQGVTIGTIDMKSFPEIGNDVLIGAGAMVLGNVKVGNRVKIGAGAVVVDDIPDGCTVVSSKATIVRTDNNS